MRFHKQIKQTKGFSLIELLVAMAILMISMTAILDFIVQYHRINLENTMRNEAMRIAEAQLEQLRNANTITLTPGTTTTPVARQIRNVNVNYTVTSITTSISQYSASINVNVRWTYRGTHNHNVSTIVSTEA